MVSVNEAPEEVMGEGSDAGEKSAGVGPNAVNFVTVNTKPQPQGDRERRRSSSSSSNHNRSRINRSKIYRSRNTSRLDNISHSKIGVAGRVLLLGVFKIFELVHVLLP